MKTLAPLSPVPTKRAVRDVGREGSGVGQAAALVANLERARQPAHVARQTRSRAESV